MNNGDYSYKEDEILAEVEGHIVSTYGEHYSGDQGVQLFDYWQSIGLMTPVAIGTAMKYLARYGKKDGCNRKDLLKAAHYIVLALWAEGLAEEGGDEPLESDAAMEGRIAAEELTSSDTFMDFLNHHVI